MWIILQDRYKRVQGSYNRDEESQSRVSGLFVDIGDEQELLVIMYEDRRMVAAKNSQRKTRRRGWNANRSALVLSFHQK